MEFVPEGITISDNDLKLIRVSRHGEELLGGALTGKSAAEVASKWKVYEPDGITPVLFEDLPLVRAIQRGEVVKDSVLVQRCGRHR
jgi:hypothetical protein